MEEKTWLCNSRKPMKYDVSKTEMSMKNRERVESGQVDKIFFF